MPDQTPPDVEAIRARLDAPDTALGANGMETFSLRVAAAFELRQHAPTDLRRLLDENARLNAEVDRRERQIGLHLKIANDAAKRSTDYKAELDRVIREAAADKARHLRIINELTADNAGLTGCLDAVIDVITPKNPDWVPLTERHPEYFEPVSPEEAARKKGWRQGVELLTQRIKAALDRPEPGPGMPHPPAQEARDAVSAATGSTGVPEPEKAAQAGESWIPSFAGDECPHRPEWTCPEHGECRACECDCNTYVADLEEPDLTLIPADMVVRDPGICSGRPTMRGTRILASRIAGELAAGTSWEVLREWYPSLPSLPVPSSERPTDA